MSNKKPVDPEDDEEDEGGDIVFGCAMLIVIVAVVAMLTLKFLVWCWKFLDPLG